MQTTAKRMGGVSLALLLAAMLTVLATFSFAAPQQAYASLYKEDGVCTLRHHYPYITSAVKTDTYKKADVTGDKKKDTVQLVYRGKKEHNEFVKNYYKWTSTTLKINGRTVKTWKGDGDFIQIVTLKNKKSFICIPYAKCVYKVSGYKLKKVVEAKKLLKSKSGYIDFFYLMNVKGNTVGVGDPDTKAFGSLYLADKYGMRLVYSKGKFKLKAGAIDAEHGQYKAKKAFKIKKSVSSSKTVATIKAGDIFTAKKAKIVKKKLYIKAKTQNGEVGWVKLGKTKLAKRYSAD